MARGIKDGVDIINTLHQKNDVDFYIAWAEDIKYDNGKLSDKLDALREKTSNASIKSTVVQIPASYWITKNSFKSIANVQTNIKFIPIEDPNDDKLIIVVPSELNDRTANRRNLDAVRAAKFDVVPSCNEASIGN